MNRIAYVFDRLKASGGKALIPYVTPEFPFPGMTLPLLSALADAGADLIELGIPFSDPLADGPTIQQSSDISIRNGTTMQLILGAVRQFRSGHDTPLLLMGYVNPILRYGLDTFLRDAREAGVDGLIVPDLPLEEAAALKAGSEERGLSCVFLIAPTSTPERMRLIDEWSTHFSYCVSVTGVTGARARLGSNGSLEEFLSTVRKNTRKPLVVGFGISTPAQVRNIWQQADGAVVGSALLNALRSGNDPEHALAAGGSFFRSLRSAQ